MILARVDAWLSARLDPRVLALALAGAALLAGLNCAPDPFLHHHLALAHSIAAHGLPRDGDPLLLGAAGPPGPFPYWLTSLLLLAAETFGGRGAVVLAAGAVLAIAATVAWAATREGDAPTGHDVALALPATLLLLAALRGYSGPRPETLATALLATTLLAARRYAEGRDRSVFLFPAVAAVWANVDGSLALGLAVPLALAGELAWRARQGGGPPLRRRAAVLSGLAGAGLLASLASPWPGAALAGGRELLAGVAAMAAHGPPIREAARPASAALCLAAVALAAAAARRDRPADGALGLLGLLVVASATRKAPLGVVLLAPALLGSVRALLAGAGGRARPLAAAAGLGASVAGGLAWTDPGGVELGLSSHSETEPMRLVELLRQVPAKGSVYAPPRLADYVAWKLDVRVADDVRPGRPPPDAPVPLEPLDARWRFDALILPLAPDGDLHSEKACGPGYPVDRATFAPVAFDDAATLWVRREGAFAELAQIELRALDPCALFPPGALSDGRWTGTLLAETTRLAELYPDCESVLAAFHVARMASGLESDPVPSGAHPVLARLRAAARQVADARTAAADATAAGGDASVTIAAYWRSLLAADTPHGRWGLALQLVGVGECAAAVLHARRALELDPGDVEAEFVLGLALDCAGERVESRAAFQAYVAARPFGSNALEAARRLARPPGEVMGGPAAGGSPP